MRFIRLRVANYRGVTAAEVKFAGQGVTLVQGPNEAGKSSLGEALGVLFEFPDSSMASSVKAIRPLHRDEGPEIELEAESGPYAFTYTKRFCKRPETRLAIAKPTPESHTGREAHERAEAILRETLDWALWKALAIRQGVGLQQPDLAGQASLSAALDRAAGGRPANPWEEGLFERVRVEYLGYYTEGGKERKELAASRKAQADAQAEVAEVGQALAELEREIERAAALQRELAQLKVREEGLSREVSGSAAALEELRGLEEALIKARLNLEAALKSEQMAQRDQEQRQGLQAAVEAAAKNHAEHAASCELSQAALSRAEEELGRAQGSFRLADGRRTEAESRALLRRADCDYYTNQLQLEELKERKARIDQARAEAGRAEEVLARNKVDPRTLKAIQEAERALLTATARLQAGAPRVLLRGLSGCRVLVDEAEVVLGAGQEWPLSVADRTRVTVPGVLGIEVIAGSGVEGLSRGVEDSRRVLAEECAKAGVPGPDEARSAFEVRREAARHLESKAQVEKDGLRELSYEQLARRLDGLEREGPAYLAQRVASPPLAPALDAARRERDLAEAELRQAVAACEAAREALAAARSLRDGLCAKLQAERVQLELLAKEVGRTRGALEQARSAVPDAMQATRLEEAVRIRGEAQAGTVAAESAWKARNPERARALAEAASGSLRTTQTRRTEAQLELTEVQTGLKIRGEEGLHEKLGAAQLRAERAGLEGRALQRRAAAARLLYECMSLERDQARQAYVEPLRKKVEGLGKVVFDETFHVQIDEELRMVARTLKGVTVPFDSLSGGAKEQLSLIFRLACSMIVAEDGGMPLILDDALGYTDPERLRLMGAVLSQAAKSCQIVIFTCVPERYAGVGAGAIVAVRQS